MSVFPTKNNAVNYRPSDYTLSVGLSKAAIVDLAERIAPFLAALEPKIGEGLVTVADVRISRYLHDPKR